MEDVGPEASLQPDGVCVSPGGSPAPIFIGEAEGAVPGLVVRLPGLLFRG